MERTILKHVCEESKNNNAEVIDLVNEWIVVSDNNVLRDVNYCPYCGEVIKRYTKKVYLKIVSNDDELYDVVNISYYIDENFEDKKQEYLYNLIRGDYIEAVSVITKEEYDNHFKYNI